MKQLDKLRSLPEGQKKMLAWGVTIAVGLGLLLWWIPNMKNKIEEVGETDVREEFSIPELEEQLNSIPNLNGQE